MTRTRLPNGRYAKEKDPKDERIEYLVRQMNNHESFVIDEMRGHWEYTADLRSKISDLRNQNTDLSGRLKAMHDISDDQQETICNANRTIKQLRSRVLGHSIAWFSIGILLASVGFLIFQYIVK